MRKILFILLAVGFMTAQVVINEIHYNPASSQGTDGEYEFLELYNVGTSAVDLTGWTVGATGTSPASLDGVTIDAGGFVIVANTGATYEGLGVPVVDAGGYFGLGNSGKTLQLIDGSGTVTDEVTYDDGAPWPTEADGGGPSLELIDPLLDNNLVDSWGISQMDGGTPGAVNSIYIAPGDNYPPVADAGGDLIVGAGETVYLDGSGSTDPDGMIVYYIWEQVSGTTVTLFDAETAVAYFTAPDGGGTLTFRLTVYDDEAEFDSDEMEVTICSAGTVTIAEARNLGIDQCVSVQGVVISPSYQGDSSGEYAIQDNTAGIILYAPGQSLGLNIGDEVLVVGTTDEYNGKFEVIVEDPSMVTVLGVTDVPAPQVVTVADLLNNGEDYESELIKIENVMLAGGNWPSEGSSSNLTITDDGVSMVTCRIDSDMEIDGSPEPTWPVHVTGVGGQYDYSDPYDSGYQILPRFISDFEETGGNQLPVAMAGADQVVAPGSTVTLDGSASYDSDGMVIGYIWEQLSGTAVTLSDYEEPVVTFTAPAGEGVLEFSLTVIDDQGAMGVDFVTVIISAGSLTIYDIQYTTDPGAGTDCYPSPYYSVEPTDYVVVSGIVTAVSPGTYPNFFIQDPAFSEWGGVYVYDASVDPQVGDELVLAALVEEYYGYTELKNVAGYAVQSTGNTIDPLVVTTAELGAGCSESGERLEGMLVRVNNVTVTQDADQYGQWYVDDGSGPCQIDDNMFDGTMPGTALGDELDYIIGVVDFSYDEHAILPRSTDDLGISTAPLTIYDIQYTENAGDGTYPSPLEGQMVTVTGIVSAANVYSSGNSNRFFITDPEGGPWHGIYVYNYDAVVALGDEVEVSGTVSEYYGLTELTNVTVTVLSTGNAVPPAIFINSGEVGQEMYEGVLVNVQNVSVVQEPDQFGQWYVDDGSGSVQIDDSIFEYPGVMMDMAFESITGVVDYSYSEFAILPRFEEDFVLLGGCETNGDVTGDGNTDVLDIVAIVAHVLNESVLPDDQICHGDVNNSGDVDVLDIVILVDMILNPVARAGDASGAAILIDPESVRIKSDGFVGGVQMTIIHDGTFQLELSDDNYLSRAVETDTETRLIIIHPEGELFSYSGEFGISEMTLVSGTDYIEPQIIREFSLQAAYPNPFNPVTTIGFTLPTDGKVSLTVYDMMGRQVSQLVNDEMSAGYHTVQWDASSFASGVYMVKIVTGDFKAVQKVSLVK